MSRSTFKGPYIKMASFPVISRNSTILPIHIGKSFKIHNGLIFVSIQISETMLDRKFGEFIWTRNHESKN